MTDRTGTPTDRTTEEDMTKAAHTSAAPTGRNAARVRGPLTPGSFAPDDSQLAQSLVDDLVDVERILNDSVAQSHRLSDEASHHLLAAGGKRVRPMLVLLTAKLGDGSRPEVRKAAAAVELIHLATLYHDDVMDDAPLRRGAPAAQHIWGNSVAILTGDLLFARASLLSSDLGVEAVRLQSATFERLVLGQLLEFTGPEPDDDPIDHYLQVLVDKTGSLIAAAGEFGLMSSGAPREYIEPLRDYGERVGIAFQLADDLIDLRGDGAKTGKTPGTDLREGVPTLPVLYARRDAEAGDAQAAAAVELLDADLSDDDALARAREALVALPTTAEAADAARAWADAAVEALDALPDGEVKDGLVAFAASVVDRVA